MPEAVENAITPTGLIGHDGTTDVGTVTPTAARTLLNVANGATVNSSDATLLARANHTGTQATSTVTGLDAALAGKAATTHTHVSGIGGEIKTVADDTYVLDEKAPAAYTINSLSRRTASGTVTLAVQINGTNVTGLSGLTGNSTPTETNASAANAVAAGDRVTLVASANSAALKLSFTLKVTG